MFKQSGTGICWFVGRNLESCANTRNAKQQKKLRERKRRIFTCAPRTGRTGPQNGASIKRFKIIVQSAECCPHGDAARESAPFPSRRASLVPGLWMATRILCIAYDT